jgi:hypothetical protein
MLGYFRAAVLTLMLAASAPSSARGDEALVSLDLTPQIQRNSLTQVTIDLDAGGSDVVRAEDEPGEPNTGAEQKLPMSVVATLKYQELRLAPFPAAAAAEDSAPLAVRHYEKAAGVLKVDSTGRTPELADDRRLIVVASGTSRPTLYSPDGPLPREQLDLIDVAGNTCLIDQLLPTSPVRKGATWNHSAAVMGALLGLDTVAVCETQSMLDEYNSNFAKIRVAGVVHGAADGAATEQEIRGVYLFDRRLRRITRLNLAVREKRSIGGATPGLQGIAKLEITIEPIESCSELSKQVVAAATREGKAADRNLLYHAAPLGLRLEHDRQWFVTSEGRETVTLRRVDQSDVVAQCTVMTLPPKSEGRQVPLEQFQRDVAYSLGKSFGQLVSSRQWTNSHGHRCFQVVVRGAVQELPVEWHYYLVAPESGHRVSLVFTMEGPKVERVGDADRKLVDAVELTPPESATKTAAHSTENPPDSEPGVR